MFNDILENMLSDMSRYHRNRNEVLVYYINKRLNDSLSTYYNDLSHSLDYLKSKDELKMMKKINRYG